MDKVQVYGADWCGDTRQALEHLDSLGVAYDYINVEQDEKAAEWVKQQNDGKERKPTIKVGERVLSTPTGSELESALRESNLIEPQSGGRDSTTV
ncbi:MAG TPA: glutaredoxin domain-containing protein [Blastocatellia bacterium]|jgi:mycoredoxin